MDELIKILIWGAIIFFFLKPLFKKPTPAKKLPTSEPESNSQAYGDLLSKESKPTLSSNSNDQYDILREIETMFKGDTGISQPIPSAQQKSKQIDPYDIYESHEIKDKDLSLNNDPRMQREVEDFNPIGYRPTYDDKRNPDRKSLATQRGQKRVVDAQTEAEALKFEKVLAGLHKKSSGQSVFRKKIKNSVSIRDYIIFSEILGKPKALRR
jgi:PHP family Zn ribbon phosphoesterase